MLSDYSAEKLIDSKRLSLCSVITPQIATSLAACCESDSHNLWSQKQRMYPEHLHQDQSQTEVASEEEAVSYTHLTLPTKRIV